MGGLFSKHKEHKITDVDRAILSLKTQRRKLTDYQKKLEVVIARETEAARQLVKEKKKDRAILTLKKRKYQEQMLERVDNWLLTVDEQISNIDTTKRQKEVFESLKTGHKAIKDLQSEIDVDEVQKLMDDTSEAKAYQEEVNRVLGQQLTDEDEETVLAEFDKLEDELLEEELPPIPVKPEEKLPEKVPEKAFEKAAEKVPALLAEEPSGMRGEVADGSRGEEAEEETLGKDMGDGEESLDLPEVPKEPVRAKADAPTRVLEGKIALKEDPMLA